jgi:hypothetical protein
VKRFVVLLLLTVLVLGVSAAFAEEKTPKEYTGWLFSLAVEKRDTEKSSWELSIPWMLAFAGVKIYGISGGKYEYKIPGCFVENYKSQYQGPRLTIVSAEDDEGNRATIFGGGYIIGYRGQSGSFAYRAGIGLQLLYVTSNTEDFNQGMLIYPAIQLDIGWTF